MARLPKEKLLAAPSLKSTEPSHRSARAKEQSRLIRKEERTNSETAEHKSKSRQGSCHVLRRFDSSSRFCRIEQQHCAAAFGQPNRADKETEQHNNRNEYRRDVNRTVLPKFPPNRPIERLRCGGSVARAADPNRFRHSLR